VHHAHQVNKLINRTNASFQDQSACAINLSTHKTNAKIAQQDKWLTQAMTEDVSQEATNA
jgi:hypothetical protein